MGLRIVFMGTPEFAVDTLEAICASKHSVVAVVTAPDRPQGRGLQLMPSAVKTCALKHQLQVLQPEKLKDPGFQEELKNFNADLFVVVAFRMLPESVWNMPRLGTYNLHASLLPQYRGAAPINWAIIRGEKESGVTTFRIRHEIDTGNILFQERVPINTEDDAGTLYDKLKRIGSQLVVKTLDAIEDGNATEIQQPSDLGELRSAPKIFRETCEINWNQPAEGVRNFIRGLSPYPSAWTNLNGKTYKIHRITNAQVNKPAAPGTTDTDQRTYLNIRTQDSWISVLELQPEGKKRMSITDFFRGNKLG